VRLGADMTEFERALGKAAKSVQRFGAQVTALGGSLTTAITVPLAAVGGAAILAFEGIDEALDKIRSGTGATGQSLEQLGGVFRSVFREMPDAAAAVGTAIADLHTRTGATGDQLGAMATQMLQLGRMTGGEVGPLIASTTGAFNAWGVATSDQTTALDFLWKVSQRTGVGVGALADQLSQGGAQLRALGVPLETAATMLGAFGKAGVTGGTAMAGLNRAAASFAQRGLSMADGFRATVDQIKRAGSSSEAAGLALQVFGRSGVTMADAIRRGALDVGALTDEIVRSGETINKATADTSGLSEAFGKLRNQLTLALEPLGAALVTAFLDAMPLFQAAISALAGLVHVFAALPSPVQKAIVGMALFAAAVGPVLVALGMLISGAASVVTSIITLKARGAAAWAAIASTWSAGAAVLAPIWTGLLGMFSGVMSSAIWPIATALVTVGRAIAAFVAGPIGIVLLGAIALIVANWNNVKTTLVSIASSIASALEPAWTAIKRGVSTAWQSISDTVGEWIGTVVSTATGIVGTIVDVATSIGHGFWSVIEPAFTAVRDFVKPILDGILTNVRAFVADALGALNWLLEKATSAARAVAEALGIGGGTVEAPTATPPVSAFPAAALAGGVSQLGGGPVAALEGPMKAMATSASSMSTAAQSMQANVDAEMGFAMGQTVNGVRVLSQPGPSAGPDETEWRDFQTNQQRTTERLARTVGAIDWSGRGRSALDEQLSRIARTGMASGGLVSGPTLAMIGERGPEAVIPLSQLAMMGGGGGMVTVNVYVSGSVATQRDIAEDIRQEIIRIGQRNRTSGVV
jgi:phage-related minor tail protein